MKTLYVLRHAKSSWDNPNQTDFERPLNERGLLAARKMGELISAQNFVPNLIVSSPAVRAKTTAEIIKKTANINAQIRFDARIYEAAISDLFEVLREETSDETESLLLVGHNPGLEDLVGKTTGEVREMPTAALVKIELEINNWKEIDSACGKLCNYFKPKEIAK